MKTAYAFFHIWCRKDGNMNEQEIRRKELLRQTRKLYNERNDLPAVHPRYSGTYHSLYTEKGEEQPVSGSSFRIRVLIAVLCFVFYIYIDENQVNVADMDSALITEQIGKNLISPE